MKPTPITLIETFEELNLSAPVMRAISDLEYKAPSAIQAQALPILLGEPTDFIGLAATGTGKTAAFSIPLIERIDPSINAVQGLILCPTRELALQVCGQINILGKYKKIEAVAVYGGASYGDQIRGLKQGAQIVVGTPGRMVDHLDRGTLLLDNVQTVILDEADEMISMGFKDDLELILKQTPSENKNIWLFSATMSREVRGVADSYLTDPQMVQINRTEMLPSTIEQIYFTTHEANKPEVLCKLIDQADDFYGLIFCQTKSLVADLTKYLIDRGYKVDCLHGDKDQRGRERTMQMFRERKVSMLVCTDVASRGLDVKDVTHVINYSIPRELDNYVHRIGRTARSGKTGYAFSLVTPSHRVLIGRIEQMTKSKMREGKIPTRKDIGAKKINQLLSTFTTQPNHALALEIMGNEWMSAVADMSKEEIISRFLSIRFPEIFNDKPEITMPGPAARAASEGRGGRTDEGRGRRSDDRRGGRSDEGRGGRFTDRRERYSEGRSFGRDRDENSSGGGERRFRRDRDTAGGERTERRFDRPFPRREFGSAERSFDRREERRSFALERESRYKDSGPFKPKSVYSNTFSKKEKTWDKPAGFKGKRSFRVDPNSPFNTAK